MNRKTHVCRVRSASRGDGCPATFDGVVRSEFWNMPLSSGKSTFFFEIVIILGIAL